MIIKEQMCFSRSSLAIDGRDLMADGVPAGPELGEILEQLLELVIE